MTICIMVDASEVVDDITALLDKCRYEQSLALEMGDAPISTGHPTYWKSVHRMADREVTEMFMYGTASNEYKRLIEHLYRTITCMSIGYECVVGIQLGYNYAILNLEVLHVR